MKKLFAITLLACISLPANAGFWDILFRGGKKEEPAPTPSAQSAPAPAYAPTTPAVSPSMMETGLQLLPLLTQSLGVSGEQASGGMGALLQAAQTLMANNEFAAITKAIPGAEALMKAAPVVKETSSGGMMNNAMSMASKYSPEAKAGTELISQFNRLGMGAEMIPKFTDVGSNYLSKSGNPELGMLLKSVIPGAM